MWDDDDDFRVPRCMRVLSDFQKGYAPPGDTIFAARHQM